MPAHVDASGTQVNGQKKLKVVCGANTGYLDDLAWIGDKTPLTLADVRVSPNNTVKPNMGSLELSEALERVLPFTAKEDNRPVLQCVLLKAGEGKLKLVSADGFRLAVVTLDYDGEGQALINRDDLRGMVNALRKAKRVRLDFEKSGDTLEGMSLIIDTEAIRYKWRGADGNFPDYEKLIPTEFNTIAHFDTIEAVKAIASLKVLANAKAYPVDLTIGNGKVVMANTEDKGQAELTADTEGEVKTRIDGSYLTQALKACGGMVDFKLTNSYSPMLFTVDSYQLVVMPMQTSESSEQIKRDSKEAEAKVEQPAEAVTEAEAVAEAHEVEAEPLTKAEQPDKPKRKHKAKEPVAV